MLVFQRLFKLYEKKTWLYGTIKELCINGKNILIMTSQD